MCENFTNSVLSNCVIIANSAYVFGAEFIPAHSTIVASPATRPATRLAEPFTALSTRCVVQGNYAALAQQGSRQLDSRRVLVFTHYCQLIGNSTPNGGVLQAVPFLNNCILTGNQSATAEEPLVAGCTGCTS